MATEILTDQNEVFCQQIGTHGKKQFEAYQIAYPKSLEWKMSAVYTEASEMRALPKITRRIEEIKTEINNSNLWTKEESVKTLKNILTRTYQDDSGNDVLSAQDKDAINAVKELNIMHGFNAPEKKDVNVNSVSSITIVNAEDLSTDEIKAHCQT